jgi:hypothetical protein
MEVLRFARAFSSRRTDLLVILLAMVLGSCGDDTVLDLLPNVDAGHAAKGSGEGDASVQTACVSDGQCAYPTPICEPTSRVCVECVKTTDCDSDQVCNLKSFRCAKSCSATVPCGEGICDAPNGVCVECLADTQCEAPRRCLPQQGRCVQCLSDADCTNDEGRRHCWLANFQCVECNSSADCAGVCTVEHACAN